MFSALSGSSTIGKGDLKTLEHRKTTRAHGIVPAFLLQFKSFRLLPLPKEPKFFDIRERATSGVLVPSSTARSP